MSANGLGVRHKVDISMRTLLPSPSGNVRLDSTTIDFDQHASAPQGFPREFQQQDRENRRYGNTIPRNLRMGG
jgi:hypothetical protein